MPAFTACQHQSLFTGAFVYSNVFVMKTAVFVKASKSTYPTCDNVTD